MKKLAFFCCILFAALMIIGTVNVHSSDAQKPFTEKELDRFIADVPSIAGLSASLGKNLAESDGSNLATADMSPEFFEKYTRGIEEKGWTPERFYYIYGHVLAVLSYLQLEKLLPALAPQMVEVQKMIQDNPMFTEEQKKELLTEMAQGLIEGNAELHKAREEISREVPASEIRLIQERQDCILKSIEGLAH